MKPSFNDTDFIPNTLLNLLQISGLDLKYILTFLFLFHSASEQLPLTYHLYIFCDFHFEKHTKNPSCTKSQLILLVLQPDILTAFKRTLLK